jgi:hypothetical protein
MYACMHRLYRTRRQSQQPAAAPVADTAAAAAALEYTGQTVIVRTQPVFRRRQVGPRICSIGLMLIGSQRILLPLRGRRTTALKTR